MTKREAERVARVAAENAAKKERRRVERNRAARRARAQKNLIAPRLALAHRMIDLGFKALAMECHPDRPDGSHAAMVEISSIREALKRVTP